MCLLNEPCPPDWKADPVTGNCTVEPDTELASSSQTVYMSYYRADNLCKSIGGRLLGEDAMEILPSTLKENPMWLLSEDDDAESSSNQPNCKIGMIDNVSKQLTVNLNSDWIHNNNRVNCQDYHVEKTDGSFLSIKVICMNSGFEPFPKIIATRYETGKVDSTDPSDPKNLTRTHTTYDGQNSLLRGFNFNKNYNSFALIQRNQLTRTFEQSMLSMKAGIFKDELHKIEEEIRSSDVLIMQICFYEKNYLNIFKNTRPNEKMKILKEYWTEEKTTLYKNIREKLDDANVTKPVMRKSSSEAEALKGSLIYLTCPKGTIMENCDNSNPDISRNTLIYDDSNPNETICYCHDCEDLEETALAEVNCLHFEQDILKNNFTIFSEYVACTFEFKNKEKDMQCYYYGDDKYLPYEEDSPKVIIDKLSSEAMNEIALGKATVKITFNQLNPKSMSGNLLLPVWRKNEAVIAPATTKLHNVIWGVKGSATVIPSNYILEAYAEDKSCHISIGGNFCQNGLIVSLWFNIQSNDEFDQELGTKSLDPSELTVLRQCKKSSILKYGQSVEKGCPGYFFCIGDDYFHRLYFSTGKKLFEFRVIRKLSLRRWYHFMVIYDSDVMKPQAFINADDSLFPLVKEYAQPAFPDTNQGIDVDFTKCIPSLSITSPMPGKNGSSLVVDEFEMHQQLSTKLIERVFVDVLTSVRTIAFGSILDPSDSILETNPCKSLQDNKLKCGKLIENNVTLIDGRNLDLPYSEISESFTMFGIINLNQHLLSSLDDVPGGKITLLANYDFTKLSQNNNSEFELDGPIPFHYELEKSANNSKMMIVSIYVLNKDKIVKIDSLEKKVETYMQVFLQFNSDNNRTLISLAGGNRIEVNLDKMTSTSTAEILRTKQFYTFMTDSQHFHLSTTYFIMGVIPWEQNAIEAVGNHARMFSLPIYPNSLAKLFAKSAGGKFVEMEGYEKEMLALAGISSSILRLANVANDTGSQNNFLVTKETFEELDSCLEMNSIKCLEFGFSLRFSLRIPQNGFNQTFAEIHKDTRFNIISFSTLPEMNKMYFRTGLNVYVQDKFLIISYRLGNSLYLPSRSYRINIDIEGLTSTDRWYDMTIFYHKDSGLEVLFDGSNPTQVNYQDLLADPDGMDIAKITERSDENLEITHKYYKKLLIGDQTETFLNFEIDQIEIGPGIIWQEKLVSVMDLGVDEVIPLSFTASDQNLVIPDIDLVFLTSQDCQSDFNTKRLNPNFISDKDRAINRFLIDVNYRKNSTTADVLDTTSKNVCYWNRNYQFKSGVYFQNCSIISIFQGTDMEETTDHLFLFMNNPIKINDQANKTERCLTNLKESNITLSTIKASTLFYGASKKSCSLGCGTEYFIVGESHCYCLSGEGSTQNNINNFYECLQTLSGNTMNKNENDCTLGNEYKHYNFILPVIKRQNNWAKIQNYTEPVFVDGITSGNDTSKIFSVHYPDYPEKVTVLAEFVDLPIMHRDDVDDAITVLNEDLLNKNWDFYASRMIQYRNIKIYPNHNYIEVNETLYIEFDPSLLKCNEYYNSSKETPCQDAFIEVWTGYGLDIQTKQTQSFYINNDIVRFGINFQEPGLKPIKYCITASADQICDFRYLYVSIPSEDFKNVTVVATEYVLRNSFSDLVVDGDQGNLFNCQIHLTNNQTNNSTSLNTAETNFFPTVSVSYQFTEIGDYYIETFCKNRLYNVTMDTRIGTNPYPIQVQEKVELDYLNDNTGDSDITFKLTNSSGDYLTTYLKISGSHLKCYWRFENITLNDVGQDIDAIGYLGQHFYSSPEDGSDIIDQSVPLTLNQSNIGDIVQTGEHEMIISCHNTVSNSYIMPNPTLYLHYEVENFTIYHPDQVLTRYDQFCRLDFIDKCSKKYKVIQRVSDGIDVKLNIPEGTGVEYSLSLTSFKKDESNQNSTYINTFYNSTFKWNLTCEADNDIDCKSNRNETIQILPVGLGQDQIPREPGLYTLIIQAYNDFSEKYNQTIFYELFSEPKLQKISRSEMSDTDMNLDCKNSLNEAGNFTCRIALEKPAKRLKAIYTVISPSGVEYLDLASKILNDTIIEMPFEMIEKGDYIFRNMIISNPVGRVEFEQDQDMIIKVGKDIKGLKCELENINCLVSYEERCVLHNFEENNEILAKVTIEEGSIINFKSSGVCMERKDIKNCNTEEPKVMQKNSYTIFLSQSRTIRNQSRSRQRKSNPNRSTSF